MEKDKRFYWLKLKRDFFKRHDIQIIESMQNGKDYILFYLKLLCESVVHDGSLRFSDEIPYNEEMLSVITHTNIDVVRSAINVFSKLNMMEILDDGTFYMNEVNKMIGSETEWAEKKRLYRQQKKDNVLPLSDKSKSIELDKDIDNIKENKKENVDYSGMETINPKIANQLVEGSNVLKIFHHWNESNIIQHRELTTGIKKQIDKALKEYSIEQIKLAISHYAEAFHSDYKYCDYKWSLEKFLKQDNCLKDFLDDGTKWNNYLDYKNKKNNPYSSKKEVSKETAYPELKKNYW